MCQLAACHFSCQRAALAISPGSHGQGFRSSKLSLNTKYTVKSSLVSLLYTVVIQTLQSSNGSINSHFTFTVLQGLLQYLLTDLWLQHWSWCIKWQNLHIFYNFQLCYVLWIGGGEEGGGGRSANLLIIGFSRLLWNYCLSATVASRPKFSE